MMRVQAAILSSTSRPLQSRQSEPAPARAGNVATIPNARFGWPWMEMKATSLRS